MSRLELLAFIVPWSAAIAVAAPAVSAPSFDHVMRPCMASEALEPSAQRAGTCLCYADELQKWTVNARLLVSGESMRQVTRRSILNQCRASSAHLH